MAIERGRKGGSKKKSSGAITRIRHLPKSVYNLYDCLQTFEQHPNQELDREQLINLAPEIKRNHARKYIYHRLYYLKKIGRIEILARGCYRLKKE